MKINFAAPLLDPKGQPFADKATLETACYAAFQQPLQTDMALPMDKRLAQYRLLQRIGAGGEQDVTAEEVAEIKDRVSRTMSLVVFGAVVEILESAKIASLPQAAPSVAEQKAS